MKSPHKLVALGKIVTCIFAFISAAVTFYFVAGLNERINSLYHNTYKLNGEVRAFAARLNEIDIAMPTLLESGGSETAASIIAMLNDRYEYQDGSYEALQTHYLGDPRDIEEFKTAMMEMRAARQKSVEELVNVSDLSEIMHSYEENVMPYSRAIHELLTRIENSANSRAEAIVNSARVTQNVAVSLSIVIFISTVLMTVLTSVNEKRKNMQIYYREHLFDLLSRHTDDIFGIYNVDDNKFEYVSANCKRILGIDSKEVYEDAMALSHYVDEESKEILNETVSSSEKSLTRECDIKYYRNKILSVFRLKIYPVKINGRIKRFIATLSDQTKIMETQKTLSDALLSANRANAAKSAFLSRMSHEIRTPMNTIIGMTTISMRHIDDRDQVENGLKKIAISSNHLLSLINDILDMSKIEDDKLSIRHELFDFKKLIENITSIIYHQAAEKNINFEVNITGLTEETLVGDSLRMNQALLNLLSNAVKFTPEHGRVALNIKKIKSKNRQILVRFSVEDSGIGMEEEFLKKIFLPFEQADSSIAQKYGGTGLGMPITKNLVTLMNGVIQVKSVINKGSEFIMEIPFELPETGVIEYDMKLDDLKVLVVDDDENTCEHATMLMNDMGISVTSVLSGAEAVIKVTIAHENGESFDICFIDWRMPDMDGIETTRQIRKKLGEDALIIIISAYDWSDIEKEAREAGVTAFISKPIFASTIYNTISSVILPKSIKRVSADEADHEKHYDFKGRKVLLAEDNEINQEIAIILLNDAGLLVDCADNGEEALAKFNMSAPDEYSMIFMDIQMPVMDGYAATREIRKSKHENAKTIPIIAMTANAFHEDVTLAKAAGMNSHIPKPIDVNALYKTIEEFILANERK